MSLNDSNISIAHIIPYLGRKYGGPVMAMAAMADSLAADHQPTCIFSIHQFNEGEAVEFSKAVEVTSCKDMTWGGLRHSVNLWAELDKASPSIIHSHGLWTDVHRAAATTARLKNVPHVLGPCGMLEPNALKRSWWKKRLASLFFQKRALTEASCLLANSVKEYNDIRHYGLVNPVAIIPNPVPGPDQVESLNRDKLFEHYPMLSEKKTLLFLGRIHPVKGLERLVRAWSQLTSYNEDWQLVLAGPDEGGYQKELTAQIQHLKCQDSIHFIGSLNERRKWAVLDCTDLFVMPSDFENFGISIAEAMLAGKPVITTTGTPWGCLLEKNAGWWVEPDPITLKAALQEGMELTDPERQAMGARGRLVAEQFSPDMVAKQLISLYKWLLQQGDRPDFVRLD